jgi:SAM-dependent methyltransferase
MTDPAVERWLAALESRHLANLTRREVSRALRALSSCYVERRAALAKGGALDGAGKRAAFALFYAPLHFLTVQRILELLPVPASRRILDLGCGTGAAGAAWALRPGVGAITGVDRSAWAVTEAAWTWRQLGLRGRASQGDALRAPLGPPPPPAVLAAYLVNELGVEPRQVLLSRLMAAARAGASVLIVEPIARRLSPWWGEWEQAFAAAGGRSDEWRFDVAVPPLQRELASAAGLDLRELTARTLLAPGRAPGIE